jgi:hypothetical protein
MSKTKQIEKEIANFDENKELLIDFATARKQYTDFKRLRKIMGKPITDRLDPAKVKRDLSGRDFFC